MSSPQPPIEAYPVHNHDTEGLISESPLISPTDSYNTNNQRHRSGFSYTDMRDMFNSNQNSSRWNIFVKLFFLIIYILLFYEFVQSFVEITNSSDSGKSLMYIIGISIFMIMTIIFGYAYFVIKNPSDDRSSHSHKIVAVIICTIITIGCVGIIVYSD